MADDVLADRPVKFAALDLGRFQSSASGAWSGLWLVADGHVSAVVVAGAVDEIIHYAASAIVSTFTREVHLGN